MAGIEARVNWSFLDCVNLINSYYFLHACAFFFFIIIISGANAPFIIYLFMRYHWCICQGLETPDLRVPSKQTFEKYDSRWMGAKFMLYISTFQASLIYIYETCMRWVMPLPNRSYWWECHVTIACLRLWLGSPFAYIYNCNWWRKRTLCGILYMLFQKTKSLGKSLFMS